MKTMNKLIFVAALMCAGCSRTVTTERFDRNLEIIAMKYALIDREIEDLKAKVGAFATPTPTPTGTPAMVVKK
jgi:hypothetical protein